MGNPASALHAIPTRLTPWYCWTLCIVVLVGLALRLGFINQTTFNPDEQIAQAVVQHLDFPRQWDTNWALSDVTEFFRYDQYNFSSYHYLLYFWKNLLSLIHSGWQNHLGAWRTLNGVFGLIFLAAAALSLRQTAGEIASIAAVSAGAVVPLLIQDAHYLRCEAMLTAGVAVLLWLATRRGSNPGWLLLVGGLIAGWMIACKVTMIFALPLLLPLLIPPDNQRLQFGKSFSQVICLIGIGCILGFLVGVPWGVVQPRLYLSGLEKMAQQYSSPMPPYTSPDMAPSIQVTLQYLSGTLGWGFWIITALGVGGLVTKSGWWRTALLLSPLVISLVFFGSHAFFAERSFSPFLPIAVLLFGIGTQGLVEMAARRSKILHDNRSLLLVVLLSTTLALPVVHSWNMVVKSFSGQEKSENDAALVRMKGNLNGDFFTIKGAKLNDAAFAEVAAKIQRKQPQLIILLDYNDPLTPSCLATLQHVFNGRILGIRESLFPEIPSCTLHTFVSPRLWLVYIPAT